MNGSGPDAARDLLLVESLLEALPHGAVVVDEGGTVTHANRRALDKLGYPAHELVGAPVAVVLPELGDGRRHGRRRDGSTFPVDLSSTPVDLPGGRHVVTYIVDVTRARADAVRMQALNRAYLTLARLNEAVVRARDADELYAETCRIAVEEGGYLGAWVAQREPGFRVRSLATAGTLDEYIGRLDLTLDPTGPRGRGPTARALRDGRSYFSEDFRSDPATRPWRDLAESYGIRAAAALPLRRDGRVIAVLTLWSATPSVFDPGMRELLRSLTENVCFALEGFDAAQRLERAVAQRDELMRRLVDAQEDERTRIASMVHDDSVQALAAVDLRLGLLARRVEDAAPQLSPTVAQLQATVEAVSGGLRELLFELEPAGADVPFVDLLREAAGHVFEHHDVRWSVEASPSPGVHLAPHTRGQALRIARDALVEARDRTTATHVVVHTRDQDGGVVVTVTDNGVETGPNAGPDAMPGERDTHLRRLRDRAEIAGGWCRAVTLEPGHEVRFWLPREVPGTDR